MTQQPDANGPEPRRRARGHPGRRHRHAGPHQPARLGPGRDELRRRQHLGQGDRHQPGQRRAGGAALRQGLRRRPRNPHRRRPRGARARPAGGLDRVYRGVEHEDEMVGLFAYCGHGSGGAAPSIDTPMHALVDQPTSTTCTPTASSPWPAPPTARSLVDGSGAARWRGCRGSGRAGSWAGACASCPTRSHRARPRWSRAHRVGGDERGGRGAGPRIIREAAAYLEGKSVSEPFGPVDPAGAARPRTSAAGPPPCSRTCAGSRRATAGRSATSPTPRRCSTSSPAPRPTTSSTSGPAAPTTSCAPRCGRCCSTPRRTPRSRGLARLRDLEEEYREEYRAYYDRHATPDSPAMRGAAPAIVLVPGVGMFSFGADKQTARVAGEFYVNAINVMRGAEGVSTYAPVDEAEKFAVEYWILEELKLQRRPKPKPLAGRIAVVTGAASGIGLATAGRSPPRAPTSSSPTSTRRGRRPGRSSAVRTGPPASSPTSPTRVAAGRDAAVLAFGGVDLLVNNAGITSRPLGGHDVRRLGSAVRSCRAARSRSPRRPSRSCAPKRWAATSSTSAQERGVRRAEQHRVLVGQGRAGPHGPAAGGRARRHRCPGQRDQPGRDRQGLGDLRGRLGRVAGQDVRCGRRRTSASTTRSGPCSRRRYCRSTWRRRWSP